MRLAVASTAVLAMAGCQTPCPAPPTQTTVATYNCEDGSDLRVTFAFPNATVEQEGYTTLVLPSRISGAAFRYSDHGASLRGRANEILWTRPGAAETICEREG
jgi:membrane-bound inhibitor of C-type lysozyme